MKRLLLCVLVVVLTICFTGCFGGENKKDSSYYIGDTMVYDNIDITVNGLSEKEITSGEHEGHMLLTVSVTLKNNKSKDFDFPYTDTYIKTKDRNQKYEVSYGFDYWLGDVIISGAKKTYEMHFYTPYSYTDTKFIIVFGWGLFSSEKEYCLFMKDGSNYSGGFKSEDEQYIETVKEMRDDIYDIFKQYVYDQITGNMYYSDIQNLIDNAERQVKTQISTFNIYYDLSSGTYSPKWIGQVTTNNSKTYSLFYIQVQLSTNYKWTNKNISKYDIK